MDVFTDVLNTLELKGWLHSRTEIAAPWRFHFTASRDGVFHIFNFGGGYLLIEGEEEPVPVRDGDVIILPHGHAHSIYDNPASPVTKFANLDYQEERKYEVFPFEGEGPRTVLLCGVFHFEHSSQYPLLRCLPNIIHIPGSQGQISEGLADILRLIARESTSPRQASEIMLVRLTEMLFIQVIRLWMEQKASQGQGWVAALGDGPISQALALIHQSPEYQWKVEKLAAAVGLSRSAFSSRFTLLVGEPPMQYLTHWRMHRAMRLLKNEKKMARVAQQLGYDSEVAFRKAFKRETGITPARFRQKSQTPLPGVNENS